MAAGKAALTSFGMSLASDLLGRTEDGLIDIDDGDRIGTVMFRAPTASPSEYLNELAALMAARNESRIWRSQAPSADMREIVRGGNPEAPPGGERADGGSHTRPNFGAI